jgi:hypothetical protein
MIARMWGQLTVIAASTVLLAPWVLLGLFVLRDGTRAERMAVGAAIGLAATVSIAHVLASFARLDAYFWVHGAVGLASLFAWRRRRNSEPTGAVEDPSEGKWLALAAALVAGFALVPTLSSTAPLGWDPAFHAILAEKVRRANGLVFDWRPFEPIPLNYPLGSHLWIVLIAGLARQAVHHTFQVQHLIVQFVAALLVYALARRLFACWRSALFAMLCYALLGNWGTFHSYYQWGGLPTELGFVLFLGLIWTTLVLDGWRGRLVGALLYGSIAVIHHLSALIATWIVAGYVIVAIAVRDRDPLWRRFTWTGIAAGLCYAPFLAPYALRAGGIGGTHAVRFSEEARLSLATAIENLGLLLIVLAAWGLWRLRARAGAGVSFLLTWVTLLVLGFAILDHGVRYLSLWTSGREFTAFTPSRFVTVLSYPLCLAAGASVEHVRKTLSRWVDTAGERLRWCGGPEPTMSVLVLLLVLGAAPRTHALSARHPYPPVAETVGAWVRTHTPENAYALYTTPVLPPRWVPYLTWRAGVYTPIPASENRARVSRRRAELAALVGRPAEFARRLAHEGKQPWIFSLDRAGQPRVERFR